MAIPSVAKEEQRPDSTCCAVGPETMSLKSTISSAPFHTKNGKIITSMYKRILGFTNMSEASKGISVSHIPRSDLSLTLSECSKEKQKLSFSLYRQCCLSNAQSSFLVPETCFPNSTVQIADLRFKPSAGDPLHPRRGRKLPGDYRLNRVPQNDGWKFQCPVPVSPTLFGNDLDEVIRVGPNPSRLDLKKRTDTDTQGQAVM